MKKIILILALFISIGIKAQDTTIVFSETVITQTEFTTLDSFNFDENKSSEWLIGEWAVFENGDTLTRYQERINLQGIRQYRIMKTVKDSSISIDYDFNAAFNEFKDSISGKEWVANEHVRVGAVRSYNGQDYEVIQAHITQSDWTPDITPALWNSISSGVSEWVQPEGAHDAYNIGDQVLFNGDTYESLIDGNVWSPTVYPAGWKQI